MENERGTARLYKSRTDRMIDGVCGGVAEYFGLDPTLVRIATVLLAIFGGVGVVLYIVAMIIMPTTPAGVTVASEPPKKQNRHNDRFWGILLVLVGGVWLLGNLGVPFWHPWGMFSWRLFLPLLLILAGVAFLFGGRNYLTSPSAPRGPSAGTAETSSTASDFVPPPTRRLYRSRLDRKIVGVCAGLGEYFGIDPTIVRLLFVVSGLASFGLTLLVYVVTAIVVPVGPEAARTA